LVAGSNPARRTKIQEKIKSSYLFIIYGLFEYYSIKNNVNKDCMNGEFKLKSKIINDLLDSKITLKLFAKKSLGRGGTHVGTFDGLNKEITLAFLSKNSIQTLVHEYCHFLQWKNKKKFWKKYGGNDGSLDEWLNGKEFSKHKITRFIKNTIRIERDCEKKTVSILKKYKIKFDEKEYIKQSNVYILSYWYIKEYRKWPNKKIYDVSFYNTMPDSFLPLSFYLKGVNKNAIKYSLLMKQHIKK